MNAGMLRHPVIDEPIVGSVARGRAKKLANLRLWPRVTVVFRSGWEWVAVEGDAKLVGPTTFSPKGRHMTSRDCCVISTRLRSEVPPMIGPSWTGSRGRGAYRRPSPPFPHLFEPHRVADEALSPWDFRPYNDVAS